MKYSLTWAFNMISMVLNTLWSWFESLFLYSGINFVGVIFLGYGALCVQRLLANGVPHIPFANDSKRQYHSSGWSSRDQDRDYD